MLSIGAFLLVCTSTLAAGQDGVLLYFSSPNCSACRAVEPVVRQLEGTGTVVRRVDGRREPDLASRYSVRQFPTFVLVRGGREVDRLIGYQTLEQFQHALGENSPNRVTNTSAQPAAAMQSIPLQSIRSAMSQLNQANIVAKQTDFSQGDLAGAVLRAERATVRIRVYDGRGFGVGTGTIVDTHGEESLVLTCGHIFRDTQGKGRVEVDLFIGGRTQTIAGQVVDFDAENRDIGLISIRPGLPVVPAPIAEAVAPPSTGQSVFTYGCDYGADPTRRDSRVAAVNKFQGPQNVEVSGAPVEGRSGGGLFDQEGRLIGVCNAADHQDDEGLYAGPEVIHWQLDRVELSHLYQRAQHQGTQDHLANDSTRIPVQPVSATLTVEPPNRQTSEPSQQDNDSEVICIVRSRNQPQAPPRVVTITQPTPELLRILSQQK